MALKTYGEIITENKKLIITEAEPHVSIKLKNIFPKLSKTAMPPYHFNLTTENCTDLLWFMERYPMKISEETLNIIQWGKKFYDRDINEIEQILMPDYVPTTIKLKEPHEAREYQLKVRDIHSKVKRLLLGDDMGLGKTLSSILTLFDPKKLPAAAVVQTHLPKQWKINEIEKYTNLTVHMVKGTKPYNLPAADVYIFKYSLLAGWSNTFSTGFFKSAIFDEIQELRKNGSHKYEGGKILAKYVEYVLALSATPMYNYADEIFNVLNLIKPDCLGSAEDFFREWATVKNNKWIIREPQALGTYLRDNHLFLRRTRKEVGLELPPINKIIHTVGYDENEVRKTEELARMLATKVMHGSFEESGQASRELDMLARKTTGVSKAREVAAYVKILLDNDETVLLAGWHRDVYDIWLRELYDYNPVMYTGSESGNQKENAKRDFMEGKTKLMIISLRSGAGLDGLQKVCRTVVIGELDWSPKVHDQLIARVDRPDADNDNPEQTTAIFLVSDYGSDPVIMNILGLKASQSNAIVDPLEAVQQQHSDESRMKTLAKQYLSKANLN